MVFIVKHVSLRITSLVSVSRWTVEIEGLVCAEHRCLVIEIGEQCFIPRVELSFQIVCIGQVVVLKLDHERLSNALW